MADHDTPDKDAPSNPAANNPDANSKVALVTGAGSGIGRAAALALLQAGYRVVLAGRREEKLLATAEQNSTPQSTLVVPTDVCRADSVAQLFAKTEREWGRLDVLFNNAGVGAPAIPLEELTLEQWQQVVDTNLTGPFLCAQQAIRLMKQQRPQGGRIINNGSISAHVPRPFSAPYTATKHAITGLTRSILLDGRPDQIVASQIDIGNAATDLTARMSAGVLQANGQTAAEPTMDANDVAAAIVYMANLPLTANVPFMTVMASDMPYIGRG